MKQTFRKNPRPFTASAFFLFASALSACSLPRLFGGAEKYDFSGTVVSMRDNDPIAGVKVTAACDKPNEDASETKTDAGGNFRLEHAFGGDVAKCDLAFEHPKYKTRALKVDLRSVTKSKGTSAATVNVRLDPN